MHGMQAGGFLCIAGCGPGLGHNHCERAAIACAHGKADEMKAGKLHYGWIVIVMGMLTTIALPHDWCNYGEAIETFKAKYGLEVNELNPDAGSGDEIEAIKANKDNKGPQAPDVIDVGFGFGPQLIEEKLASK